MTRDTNSLYDRWAPVYPSAPHNRLMVAEHRAMTTRLLRLATPASVLDAGSGTGRYTEWLRARGAGRVTSVDRSRQMLAHQRGSQGCVQADLHTLPFPDGSFDLVVAGLALGEVSSLAEVMIEWRRVLMVGGDCVYSDFHPSWSSRGWRRTFRDAAGTEVELPLIPHATIDHRRDAGAARMRVLEVAEVPMRHPWLGRWRPSPPALVIVHAVAE